MILWSWLLNCGIGVWKHQICQSSTPSSCYQVLTFSQKILKNTHMHQIRRLYHQTNNLNTSNLHYKVCDAYPNATTVITVFPHTKLKRCGALLPGLIFLLNFFVWLDSSICMHYSAQIPHVTWGLINPSEIRCTDLKVQRLVMLHVVHWCHAMVLIISYWRR